MKKKKKIGFFGGSFDPIHFGHINLALQILEIHQLDGILFCPARCSPHKKVNPPKESFSHRLEMVKKAITNIPNFYVTDIEEKGEGLSYTIDTINLLKKEDGRFHDTQFNLVLSEDSINYFYCWKEVEKLVELAPPLFGTRNDSFPTLDHYISESLAKIIKKGLTKTKVMDISSTDIRDRLKNKLYCYHLMPTNVLDYIYNYALYYSS